MNGSINLESTYGTGTKMTVVLPLEKAPLTLTALPAPDLPQGDLVRESTWILVAGELLPSCRCARPRLTYLARRRRQRAQSRDHHQDAFQE